MAKEVIGIDLYFKDFVTKKDRRKQFKKEFKQEIQDNAKKLLDKVNALLADLGVEAGDVTSGWRPASMNGAVTNAAKKSYHMLGMAVDLLDNDKQDLGKLIASRPDLLKKYDLWLEDLGSTIGKNTNWVHLDVGTRQDRPSRIFKP